MSSVTTALQLVVCSLFLSASSYAQEEAAADRLAAVEAAQAGLAVKAATLAFPIELEALTLPPEGPAIPREEAAKLRIALLSYGEFLRAALTDQSPAVRFAAARALGFIEDKSATEKVTPLLTDEIPSVRRAAACALAIVGNIDTEDALMDAARDAEPSVRAAALYAMRSLFVGERAAVRALADPSAAVRHQAALLLSLIRPFDAATLDAAGKALLNTLSDESQDVRAAAAAALGRLGRPEAVSALVAAIGDKDETVRKAAVASLGDLGGADAIEALRGIAKGGGPLAEDAVNAIAASGERSPETVELFADLMSAAPLPLARAATRALASLGGDEAKQALVSVAKQGNRSDLLPYVAQAASRLGTMEPAGLLLRQLRDSNVWNALGAARGLAAMRNPAGFPLFIKTLDSDDTKERTYAAACLALYTGVNMDYLPDGQNRTKIALTWRRWWQTNRETFVVPRDRGVGLR